MGKFLAVVLSYFLVCSGLYLFRDSAELNVENELATYIFLTSVFLLLYDLRLYPKILRKLGKLSQSIIEFLVSSFLMENILFDFWLPLKEGNKTVITKLAEKMDESVNANAELLEVVVEWFNFVLSLFFFFSVLHAIRAVDFRALQEGPSCFFGDISYRLQRFLRRKLKILGIKRQRRVQIVELKEMPNTRSRNERKKSKTSISDCNVNEDYDGTENLDDTDFDIPCDNELCD